MGKGILRTAVIALTCLTTGVLSGQGPPDLAAKRTALAEAAQQLRAAQTEVVIGALERIVALTDDRVEADELGIVPVLATALGSRDTAVVTACVAALAKTPNRSAGTQALTKHLAVLVQAVRQAPIPRWPVPTVDLSMPPFPPPLGASDQAHKEYQQKLARWTKARDARRARNREQQEREVRRAEGDEQRQIAAVTRLVTYSRLLANAPDDAVIDELLRALDLTLDRAPQFCDPIVGALCTTPRRDAIAKCVAILARPDTFRQSSRMLWERSRAYIGLPAGDRGDKADADGRDLPKTLRADLSALGARYGVAAPDADTLMDQVRSFLGVEGGRAGSSNPWQEWFQRLAPALPERLGSTAGR